MAAGQEQIEKISRVEGVGSKESVGSIQEMEPVERVPPNKERFDALVNPEAKGAQATSPVEGQSQRTPLESPEVTRTDIVSRKTPAELVEQTTAALKQVDEIKSKLQTPGLELDTASQMKMRNHLSHIDDRLQISLSKEGNELQIADVQPSETEHKSFPQAVQRFLGFMEDSEAQLQNILEQVAVIGGNRDSINPAAILSMQLKVGFVQQELEFFTNVLNKALESTKTLMNVQV